MTIYPVIMCGGSGTRLWPASRQSRPKQFIPLIGERSTFQSTMLRLAQIGNAARPLVVAGVGHAFWIKQNLDAIDLKADVLLEPEARDSAAAIAAAAAWVAQKDPDGVLAILAADHHIPDSEAFTRAVERAAVTAERGWIVTLGVTPDNPSTAYGYIASGEAISEPVMKVSRFVEKPQLEAAQGFVKAGYLWNSGNFISSASYLLQALDHYAPAVCQAAQLAVANLADVPGGQRLGEAFKAAPKISFDYAVMEKTDRAAVLPVSFAWSDLGAWDAIWAAAPKDDHGNAVSGSARLAGVNDSVVRIATGQRAKITLLGLSGVAVIADETDILIANLASSQGVKAVEASSRTIADEPERRLQAYADRYFRWLRTAALPLWWCVGADHQKGGHHDTLDQNGMPVLGPKRARVQARQSFVFAKAAAMGLPGDWRLAADHGLTFLSSAFLRPDGLYRTTVSADGDPIDDAPYLYDHTFVLLALATLASADGAPGAHEVAAASLLDRVRAAMAHPAGGFREAGAHPFQANAHMHLLEAALAWIEAGGGEQWRELAKTVVDLCLSKFVDPRGGFLREFFTDAWAPADGPEGELVEPGHQFEWAWLLVRWSELSGDREPLEVAQRLFQVGTLGVDSRRSVAIDELSTTTQIRNPRARLWPQTEYIKASLILAKHERHAGRPDGRFVAHAAQGAAGLSGYLDVPVEGLWRDKMLESSLFIDEPAPASSLYHILGAILALGEHVAAKAEQEGAT